MIYLNVKDGSFYDKKNDKRYSEIAGYITKLSEYEGNFTRDGKSMKFKVWKVTINGFEVSFNQSGYAFMWLIDAMLNADLSKQHSIKLAVKETNGRKYETFYLLDETGELIKGTSQELPTKEAINDSEGNYVQTSWIRVNKWISRQIDFLQSQINKLSEPPTVVADDEDIPF